MMLIYQHHSVTSSQFELAFNIGLDLSAMRSTSPYPRERIKRRRFD